jgi:hypothetical protein
MVYLINKFVFFIFIRKTKNVQLVLAFIWKFFLTVEDRNTQNVWLIFTPGLKAIHLENKSAPANAARPNGNLLKVIVSRESWVQL